MLSPVCFCLRIVRRLEKTQMVFILEVQKRTAGLLSIQETTGTVVLTTRKVSQLDRFDLTDFDLLL